MNLFERFIGCAKDIAYQGVLKYIGILERLLQQRCRDDNIREFILDIVKESLNIFESQM